jgi:hypothetical protein
MRQGASKRSAKSGFARVEQYRTADLFLVFAFSVLLSLLGCHGSPLGARMTSKKPLKLSAVK